MFISIVLILIAFLLLIAFRDTLHNYFFFPSSLKRRIKKISNYIDLHQFELAKKELAFLLERKICTKDVLLLQIQVLRGTEEFEKALILVSDALTQFPRELLFQWEQGKIHLAMKRGIEAFRAFKSVKHLLRNEADLIDFAESCLLAHEIEEGSEVMAALIEKGQSERMTILAADFLMAKKEFSLAIQLYNKAIESGSASATNLIKLGEAYRRLGNLKEAERLFKKILEKDSSDIEATLGYGSCLQERGQYQKALLFYQSQKSWEKKDPVLLFRAAVLSILTSRYKFAIHYLNIVIGQSGSTPELLTYLGYAYEKEGLWLKAEENYKNLLTLYPSHPNGYLALSWLVGVGRSTLLTCEEGLHLASRSLKLNPSHLALEILSACEARAGNFEKAHQIQEYLASIEKNLAIKNRRLEAMRQLRKQLPLEDFHIQKNLVA